MTMDLGLRRKVVARRGGATINIDGGTDF